MSCILMRRISETPSKMCIRVSLPVAADSELKGQCDSRVLDTGV